MSLLAFICTRPADWDPLCRSDQLLMLVVIGAFVGAGLTNVALRNRNLHIALSVLLYVGGTLAGAIAVTVLGFQF